MFIHFFAYGTDHGKQIRVVDRTLLGLCAMHVAIEENTSDRQTKICAECVNDHRVAGVCRLTIDLKQNNAMAVSYGAII
jgi:hypothetical protein